MRIFYASVLTVIALTAAHPSQAQAPPGINYQGVARDLDGKPLVLRDINIRINILKDGPSGTLEYSEYHKVRTNSFGLFTLVVGEGEATNGNFKFISWAVGGKWLMVELDPEGGENFHMMGSQQFTSVPYAFYAQYSGNGLTAGQGISIANSTITNTGDADNNSLNEVNTGLTLGADNKLRITDAGGTREADLSSLRAAQTLDGVLALGNDGGAKRITNIGTPVTANDAATKAYVDAHTDGDASASNELQELQLAGNSLTLTGASTANVINLGPYLDNTDAQSLVLSGSDLSISGGNTVNLSAVDTDSQDLTLAGSTLSLSNDATSVDLAIFFDNTDVQTLSASTAGTDTRNLSISGGNSIALDVRDADANPTNELQDLTLTSNALGITSSSSSVDLTPYLDNTDGQTLSSSVFNADTRTLAVSGGNSINLDVRDADASATNELQDLALSSNNLSLSGSGVSVSLLPYLDNTDDQILVSGNIDANTRSMSITGGNLVTVDVRDADASTTNELQDLSLTANTLGLSGSAATVNLAGYMDNTDAQTLVASSVDANTRNISISGGNNINVDVRDADASVTNELQDLSLAGNVLSLSSSAATANLAPYLDNTDNQVLSAASVDANTRSLTVSGGNTLNVDVRDGDFSSTNELQNLSAVLSQGTDAGGQRITNLAAPTAPADATTKQYVDNADAALSAMIATTYAFKTAFSYNNPGPLVANDQPMTFTVEEFDDFNVLGSNIFTATSAGVYSFTVDGSYSALIAGGQLSLFYNGVKYPVAIVQPWGGSGGRFNATFMFRMTAGQTVSLIGDNILLNGIFAGTFFGYKL